MLAPFARPRPLPESVSSRPTGAEGVPKFPRSLAAMADYGSRYDLAMLWHAGVEPGFIATVAVCRGRDLNFTLLPVVGPRVRFYICYVCLTWLSEAVALLKLVTSYKLCVAKNVGLMLRIEIV